MMGIQDEAREEPGVVCRVIRRSGRNPLEPSGLSCRLERGHKGYHQDGNWAWPESNSTTRRGPSDAEVEAAAKAAYEDGTLTSWRYLAVSRQDAWRLMARAALRAAQEVRRDA